MLNKVILVGNVGRTPEVRVLETGSKMARFTMATNEQYYSAQGTQVNHTEWHNIVAWRATADYVEKTIDTGAEVYVEGRIRSRQAVDPRTKTSQTIYEIVAYEVRLTNPARMSHIQPEQPAFVPQEVEDPNGLPF